MFESNEKSTGTEYVTTVALVVLALVFCPAVLIVSGPPGFLSVLLAVGFSAGCGTLAWFNWHKYSRLTIPTLEARRPRAK